MPPLTPKFNLSQTETEVLVTVYVPAASSLASFCGHHHDADADTEGGRGQQQQGVEIYLSDDGDNDDNYDDDDDDDDDDQGQGVIKTATTASTLHFFASPCYLLKLNFSPYKFYIPTTTTTSSSPSSGGGGEYGVPPAFYNPADHTICIHLKKAPLPLQLLYTVRANTTTPVSSASLSSSSTNDDDDEKKNNKINNNNNDNVSSLMWPDFDTTLSSKWVVQSAFQNNDPRHNNQREIPKQWLHAVVDNNNDDGGGGRGDDKSDEERNAETSDSKLSSSTETNLGSTAATAATAGLSPSSGRITTMSPSAMYGYGFGDMFQRILTDYCRAGLAQEMLELGKVTSEDDDVECVSPMERYHLRTEKEQDDFDPDRYLGDYSLDRDDDDDDDDDEEDVVDYMYSMVVSYVPWWKTTRPGEGDDGNSNDSVDDVTNQLQTNLTITPPKGKGPHNESSTSSITPNRTSTTSKFTGNIGLFTTDEHILLTSIPYPLLPQHIVSCPPDSPSNQSLWCGLLDILLAYMYDHLTTMGDPTVESAWTVSILSPRLSWLDNSTDGDYRNDIDNDNENDNYRSSQSFHDKIQFTVLSFIRRMLIYPYWRNYNFGMMYVVRNVSDLLEHHGFLGIIKCLLQTRSILTKSECYYLNNKIWIDPYLCWIQGQYRLQELKQQHHQQQQQSKSNQLLDSGESLLGQLIKSLMHILDKDTTHEESSSSKCSSLKDRLGLDLHRYECMLLADENDSETTDDDDSEDDEHDEQEESSDEINSSDEASDDDDDDSDDDSRHDDEDDNNDAPNQVQTDAANNEAGVEKTNTGDDEEEKEEVGRTDQNGRLCLDDIVGGGSEQQLQQYHNNVPVETDKRRPLIEELS